MAKRPPPTHLPTTTSARRIQPHGGALNTGNPGNRGGRDHTNAFRQRAAQRLEDAHGLEVLARILSGDILELVKISKLGDPIVGVTANDTRINAFRELRKSAGYGDPGAVNVETTGDVKVVVIYDTEGPA